MTIEILNDSPFQSLHGNPIKFTWTNSHITRFQMDRLGEKSYIDQDSIGDRIYEAMLHAGENKLFPWFLESNLESPIQSLQVQMSTVPAWVDWEIINQGQKMFCAATYGSHILSLTFTLLGGFYIPELNDILISSRYWVGKGDEGRKDTNLRIIETWRWYSAVMRENLKPGGKAWMEVMEIRMLHSRVRSQWNEGDCVAISQLHLLVMLSGFQYNYLRFSKEHLGMTFERKELEAWTMLWRYVGYCLGIQEKALVHFSDFRSSEIWWQSMVEGLLLPDLSTKKLTNHVIGSIAENMPYISRVPQPRALLQTVYRAMLPSEMGDCLGYKKSIAWDVTYRILIYNYSCFLALHRFLRKIPFMRQVTAVWWMGFKPAMKLLFRVLVAICKKLTFLYKELKKRMTSLKKAIELMIRGQ